MRKKITCGRTEVVTDRTVYIILLNFLISVLVIILLEKINSAVLLKEVYILVCLRQIQLSSVTLLSVYLVFLTKHNKILLP